MSATAFTRKVDPVRVDKAETDRFPATLPPPGASPAGDLQRRVSDAALRGFYSSAKTPRWRRGSQLLLVLATVCACWAAVFGLGALFIY